MIRTVVNGNFDKFSRCIYEEVPSMCPICHKSIQPIVIIGVAEIKTAQVVFQCPDEKCKRTFIATYKKIRRLGNAGSKPEWRFFRIENLIPKQTQFSPFMTQGFPDFVEIYHQAEIAEGIRLNHVSGPGYRKALEFLIKDYVTRLHPENAEEIRIKLLSDVIKTYIPNHNIKDMAERAAWLGNDETHYYRKWKDKDVSDLKRLIGLTIGWIEMEQQTKLYRDGMTNQP